MADNQSCNPFTKYVPFSVTRTQTICYSVKDLAGNNVSGSKKITVASANTCSNTIKDGDETDIDCGASCGSSCQDGKICKANNDCFNLFCKSGKCTAPTCTDIVQNNKESDVDCGGPNCNVCVDGKICSLNSDCANGFCNPNTKTCGTPSCTDGAQGGNETDIDCGDSCPKCVENRKCMANSDCLTNKCEFGACVREIAPTRETPTQAVERTFFQKLGSFLLSWSLIIFGILCISGGSGYIYYKHTLPPSRPTIQGMGREAPRPLTREELERRRGEEERKKRLEEALRQRLSREEQLKREKRSKLFEAFGGKQPTSMETPKERASGIPVKETKEEWLSLEGMTQKLKGIVTPKQAIPPAKKDEEFEKLAKITGKTEDDIFARLPSREQAHEEDVFAKLPEGEPDREILRRINDQEARKPAQKKSLNSAARKTNKTKKR